MNKIICMLTLNFFISIGSSHAFEFPLEVFRLMAETTAEPCSICVKQKLDKAFKKLNINYRPGKIMEFDEKCRLMKAGNDNELKPSCYPTDHFVKSLKEGELPPSIVFEFYTTDKRLVGISGSDCTDEKIADQFWKAEPGTVFEGQIMLVSYKYGDGPSYNYFPKNFKLVFHCVILDLKPIKP